MAEFFRTRQGIEKFKDTELGDTVKDTVVIEFKEERYQPNFEQTSTPLIIEEIERQQTQGATTDIYNPTSISNSTGAFSSYNSSTNNGSFTSYSTPTNQTTEVNGLEQIVTNTPSIGTFSQALQDHMQHLGSMISGCRYCSSATEAARSSSSWNF